MKQNLLILLCLLLPNWVAAQSFEGDWNGKLSIGAQKLTLVFHLQGESCTMDSPDQGAKGIPAQIVKQTADSLVVKISAIGGTFQGKKNENQIEGTFSQRGVSFPLTLSPGTDTKNRPQTPKAPFPYQTKEVIFTNPTDGAQLAGTLTTPNNYTAKTPVVLLVSGSGLQNRDEELFEHKPFAVIADYLARQGIASLRYDDRSFGKSTGDASQATTEQFRQDAEAGIQYLREKEGFKKVGIIGHSEGGTIAYLLGAAKKVDFLIALAGPTVSGKAILVEQNRLLLSLQGLPKSLVNGYCKVLDKAFDVKIQKIPVTDRAQKVQELMKECQVTLPTGLEKNMELILVPSAWTDYFLALDPSEALQKMACPALLLNGESDMQVPASLNFKNLPTFKNKKSLSKTYPQLNHLFQHCLTGAVAEYGEIEETISPEVLEDIAQFISQIKKYLLGMTSECIRKENL